MSLLHQRLARFCTLVGRTTSSSFVSSCNSPIHIRKLTSSSAYCQRNYLFFCNHSFGLVIPERILLSRHYPLAQLSLSSSASTATNSTTSAPPPPPPPSTGKTPDPSTAKPAGPEVTKEELSKKLNSLKAELDKANDALAETKDKYVRSLAETENVRRRLQREVETAKQFAMQGFCKDLLEFADTLGVALASTEPKEAEAKAKGVKRTPEEALKAYEDLLEGLRGTNSILKRVFAKHGLQSIEPAPGTKFDPTLHHAVFLVPLAAATDPKTQAGAIATVSKPGYLLHNRTIRPAMVGVFQKN